MVVVVVVDTLVEEEGHIIDAGNGGSYNSGTERENYSEFNTGEGKLEITNLSSNETLVFSNASSTGNLGKIQSEIDSAYTSTNLNGNVKLFLTEFKHGQYHQVEIIL